MRWGFTAGAVNGAATCNGDWSSSAAPTQLITTHLAFGDAQTVAMLNLWLSPYKTEQSLHRTEMSGVIAFHMLNPGICRTSLPATSDRSGLAEKARPPTRLRTDTRECERGSRSTP
jgi:hypothetical protein